MTSFKILNLLHYEGDIRGGTKRFQREEHGRKKNSKEKCERDLMQVEGRGSCEMEHDVVISERDVKKVRQWGVGRT